MTYCVKNYRTKAALRADLDAGIVVQTREPGLGNNRSTKVYLEGPHGGQHTWQAVAITDSNGCIIPGTLR